uniref:DNA 3'-phosphatase n=1 Tax=viral metagenome TaxID=1070528 RepID=A0A6C0EIW6_9ZZZZ
MDSTILIYNSQDLKENIATFDLDHTLIQPKNNKVFPTDNLDWEWKANAQSILKLFNQSGWSIVVFTNQGGVEKGLITKENLLLKFKNINSDLNLNITFVASIKHNYNRKPFPGMWNYFIKEHCFKNAFYCGDAFDPTHRKLKASDLKFALNLNIPFIKNTDLFKDGFQIETLSKLYFNVDRLNYINFTTQLPNKLIKLEKLKFIQFITPFKYLFIVAPPSSGKTTFCKKYLSNYIRLSKDNYPTPSKYMKEISNYLNSPDYLNSNIVFDNTNYTSKSRDVIIQKLLDNDVELNQIGFIYIDTAKQNSLYLNNYRHFISEGSVKLLPEIAIHKYYKSLEIPIKNTLKLSNWIQLEHLKMFIM